jgi:hypothetical protein
MFGKEEGSGDHYFFESLANDAFRFTVRVDIGSIPSGDALLPCSLQKREGLFISDQILRYWHCS